jgi:DNA-binding transcriptional ArsR family regulator
MIKRTIITIMRNDRCCPIDPDAKMVWESEIQKDLDSLKNANVGEIAELLKVISNPTRFKIIMLLFKGDYCVCELVQILQEKQNLISYNLGILKKHQIIESYNRSRDKYYKLNLDGDAMPLIRYIEENLVIGF